MRIKLFFLVLSFWSYEISTILTAFQPQLVYASHSIRILAVLLGIFVIFNQKDQLRKPSIAGFTLIMFLIVYLVRLLIDSYYFGIISSVGNSKYLLVHIISNLVPVIIISFVRFDENMFSKFIRTSVLLLAIVIGVAILNGLDDYLTMAITNAQGSIRFDSQKISPIQMGHYGVSLLLLTWLSSFRNNIFLGTKLVLTVLAFAAIILGNSKGPIISLIIVYLVTKTGDSRGVLRPIVNIVIAFLILVIIWATFNVVFGIDFLDRFYGITKSSDTSTVSRILSIREAWTLFTNSPIFGARFVTVNGGYPHNIILEALMSTGLIGAGLLLNVLYKAITIRSYLFKESMSIYLLLVQWLLGFMFSFSLYQAVIVFVSLSVLLNVKSEKKRSVLL